jgi:hypothetical protein
MKMVRSAVLFVLSASLIILTVTAANADSLIVPGQRIGPVRLGMTLLDVFRILGDTN